MQPNELMLFNGLGLQFVFSQILKIDPENSSARKGNIVLDILSNYTRINAPGIDELVEARKGKV